MRTVSAGMFWFASTHSPHPNPLPGQYFRNTAGRGDQTRFIGQQPTGLLLAGLVLLVFESRAFAFSAKPNIIFILCDDLGYGDVACLNPQGKIATPAMDRLAAEGMIFTDAHSGSSVCSPTRYGVMTGRYS